jgi:hypothetical protein
MNELNLYIKNQIKKDIDDYDFSLKKYYDKLLKYKHYKSLFLFIVHKNDKIYIIFNNKSDDARKNLIINIITDILNNMKKKKKKLPDFFLPFYVSDTYFYQDNDMFFFVEAKPKNKKGILYPDQNYYYINIENNMINYDQLKELFEKKNCSDLKRKKPIIYFSGANTGSDKHNIRMKLNDIISDNIDSNYDIHVNTQYVPMYDFCSYKYLLNLPGHQPWSYRMTKILLMKSLIYDVSVYQTYIYEKNGKKEVHKNDKWIQFYSDYFKEGEDYIQINYDWTEGLTSDLQVKDIYDKCNHIFKEYENNIEEYKRITENGYLKATRLNMNIFNDTFEQIIEYFIEKIYKSNEQVDINNFINNLLLFDQNILVKDLIKIKNEDIDRGYFINDKFIKNVLNLTDKRYELLSVGYYDKYKVEYIYNNIVTKNNESKMRVLTNYNKNIYNNEQLEYIKNTGINGLLDLFLNKILLNYFDYIFIFENNDNENFLQILILAWNLLKYNGYLIIDLYKYDDSNINNTNINNSKPLIDDYMYFKIFKELFIKEINISEKIGKRVVIQKLRKINIYKEIPKNITTLVNNYIENNPTHTKIILPKYKDKKFKWNFALTDDKPKLKIELNDLYYKYVLYANNNDRNTFIKFDLEYLLWTRKSKIYPYLQNLINYLINTFDKIFYKNNNKNLNDKIGNIIDILNLKQYPNEHTFMLFNYLINNCSSHKRNIRILQISNVFHKPDIKKYIISNIYKNLKIKPVIYYQIPLKINMYKNSNLSNTVSNNKKIKYKYFLMDKNLLNFDSIINTSKLYKNNLDYIGLHESYNIIKYPQKIGTDYNIYMCIHLLYLILSTQKKGGNLYFSNIYIVTDAFIEFIYILNNYYEKIEITNNVQFIYTDFIVLNCYNFKGIHKFELKNFLKEYYPIYDKYIKNNINLYKSNNFDFPYIKSIISNKIPKKFIDSIVNFNKEQYNILEEIIKKRIKINEIYNNNDITIQRYIFSKIFETQYTLYMNYTNKIKEQYESFISKCTTCS